MDNSSAIVIGAGFSGLSAASFLAREGYEVDVIEKHGTPGGRARQFVQDGFVFDMGPSWYWMPDVFERFFAHFGTSISQHYDLKKLDPAFRVIFSMNDIVDIPAETEAIYAVFESIEPGSASQLKRFLKEAAYKYDLGMTELAYKPGLSWTEMADPRLFKGLIQLGVFQTYAKHVRKYFSDPRLIRIMEFPVLFLGGTAQSIPAMYSLMAYAGLALGTWYPMGGMYRIVEAMYAQARDLGVRFHFDNEVRAVHISERKVSTVVSDHGTYVPGAVVASADYHHVEQELLGAEFRTYSGEYWSNRTMAPSALIFYLGIDRKVPRLQHHNLFFDAPFDAHAEAIYHHPHLPENPLFYVCAPSVTDPSVAPPGSENLFVLVPLSTELEDSAALRNVCFEKVMGRLETYTGVSLRSHIVFQRIYSHQDFRSDYHALRGNAYGLANTLMQTANLKPRIRSRKVDNLFYAGQLTVPGPGVPPALISGEIAASLVHKMNLEQPILTRRHAAATL